MATYQGNYLPKLKSSEVAAPREGVWGLREDRIVTDLANALDTGEPTADGNQAPAISSIPDVYARPLLFQSAFRNEQHPAHRACVQEWRGLLSLLALYEVKPGLKEKLRLLPVGFAGHEANPLVRAVQQLKPPAVQLQDAQAYEWDKLVLVQFDGITLGALSPSTLVFTAAEYDLRTSDGMRPHIGQFCDAQGRLRPPLASKDPDDLLAIGEWLLWLKPENQPEPSGLNKLIGSNAATKDVRGAIFRELQAWVGEIRAAFPNRPDLDAKRYRPGTPTETVPLAGAPWLADHAVYQLLLTPLRLDEKNAGGAESDRALLLANRARVPYKHVVVVQPGMDKSLRLWNDVKLETLGNNPFETLFQADHGLALGGYEIRDGDEKGIWIRPELFFLTSTLTYASGSGAFLADAEAAANGGKAQFLLPLRAHILDYFTVEEITEVLRPGYAVEGVGQEIRSVTFTLHLPVRHSKNPVVVAKKYVLSNPAPGEGRLEERPVPVLELFPNYVGDFWGRYYLLSSDTDVLQARPVNKAVQPTEYFVGPTQQRRADNLRVEITRIGGQNSFPEAVALQERAGTGDEAGLILLDKYAGAAGNDLRVQFDAKESAIFGIDFGTSNTNVFIKQGDTSQPLTLRFSQHVRPLTAANAALSRDINHAFLVPADDDRLLPMPTALRVFDPGVRDALLLDYFIYVPKHALEKLGERSEIAADVDYSYPANVQVNLKWQDEDRDSTSNFLEALVFLLVLEAVSRRISRVEFRCTYPRAFSDPQQGDYTRSWEQALRNIAADGPAKLGTGRAFLVGSVAAEGTLATFAAPGLGFFSLETKLFARTEGEAAGEYFSKEAGASLQSGAVCLDVGGGTTDFSLLYEGRTQYDASVLLAGREISQMLMNSEPLYSFLFTSPLVVGVLKNAAQAANRDTVFPARLNFFLQAERKMISARLAQNGTAKIIKPLQRVLLVEFGALAYYAGHLVLALNAFRGEGRLAASVAQRGIGLYWGGNASKMLDWMDLGKFSSEGSSARMLNLLFGSVLSNKDLAEDRFVISSLALLKQQQSRGQKNEAAGGVVQMSTFTKKAAEVEGDDIFDLSDADPAGGERTMNGLVLGERVTINGTAYAPHHYFSKKQVENLLREPLSVDTDLEQLDRLLLGINKWGGLEDAAKITLDNRQRLDIRNHLHDLYAGQLSLAEGRRTLEPALIVEVRYLLKLIRENKI